MANEITVRVGLTVRNGNVQYSSGPIQQFQADMSGNRGPSPGAFLATTDGVDIDLSNLSNPGVCILKNLDDSTTGNAVTFGVWDETNSVFYPYQKLLPGEQYPLRLAVDIEDEYSGTSTSTTATVTTWRVKSENADVPVSVEAFET